MHPPYSNGIPGVKSRDSFANDDADFYERGIKLKFRFVGNNKRNVELKFEFKTGSPLLPITISL